MIEYSLSRRLPQICMETMIIRVKLDNRKTCGLLRPASSSPIKLGMA